MYIDTHAHIFSPFYEDISSIIEYCKNEGIEKVINIATSIEESEEVLKLSKIYPSFFFPSIGLHPELAYTKTKDELRDDIKKLEMLITHNHLVAIGEFGLDYKDITLANKTEVTEKQLFLLRMQLELSVKYNLPCIIHCRQAYIDFLSIIKEHALHAKIKGVLHSVDADIAIIQELITLGFFVSFNGIVTFKNAINIHSLAEQISIDNIILETDSPFLAPMPLRGTQNTPANIPYIYKRLAQIKSMTIEDVIEKVNENAANLFQLS